MAHLYDIHHTAHKDDDKQTTTISVPDDHHNHYLNTKEIKFILKFAGNFIKNLEKRKITAVRYVKKA